MAKYTLWEAVNLALAASTKALSEVRQLARTPPPPGRDGLGFDDLKHEYDGKRTLKFIFEQGERRKEFAVKLGFPVYQGTYRRGVNYEACDQATHNGGLWIAERDTTDTPGTSDAWKLCGKREVKKD